MMKEDEGKLNGKHVLVFGGYGFIGSNFIRRVLEANPEVRILCVDKCTYSGNSANLDDVRAKYKTKKVKFGETDEEEIETGRLIEMVGDIAVKKDVDTAFAWKPDYVINFAAETHVDRSIHTASMEFIETNINGVYNILEAVKKANESVEEDHVIRFVQVSTDEVYGQLPSPYDPAPNWADQEDWSEMAWGIRFSEDHPFKPNVPYSATKAAGDCMCNAWNHTWGVPVVVTHCSNNYGPYQYPEKLVPFWVTRIINGQKIPIYGDGLNIRDWIHVDDHISALVAVMLRGKNGEVYNIGADNEKSNIDMAKAILSILAVAGAVPVGRVATDGALVNIEPYIEYVADRPGHDRRYAIDHSKITKELGWEPEVTADKFVDKLRETIEWYANNHEWVAEIVTRTGVANPHIDLWKAHPSLNKNGNKKRKGDI